MLLCALKAAYLCGCGFRLYCC